MKVIAKVKEFETLKFQKYGPKVREWLEIGPAQFFPPSMLDSITHNKR